MVGSIYPTVGDRTIGVKTQGSVRTLKKLLAAVVASMDLTFSALAMPEADAASTSGRKVCGLNQQVTAQTFTHSSMRHYHAYTTDAGRTFERNSTRNLTSYRSWAGYQNARYTLSNLSSEAWRSAPSIGCTGAITL